MNNRAQQLKAKIHIAKKDLALDDDTYRQMLVTITGKNSCAEMSDRQLVAVLESLKARGWRPTKKRKVSPKSRHKKPGEKSLADKLRAQWIQMHEKGLLRDGSEKALGNYCHRMVRKHSPDWLTAWEAQQVIESLKQWQKRLEKEL